MSVIDQLHQLISSLTQSEKRSFKIFASRHVQGEKNNYVELFDEIARQESYDETAIRTHFAGTSFVNRLSYEKNYLRKLIFRAMRGYKERSDTEAKVRYLIADAAFLRRKGLYEQEARALEKAFEIAQKYEKFHFELEILDLQRQTIVVERVQIKDKIAHNQKLRSEVLDQLANFYQYQNLADLLFVQVRGQYELSEEEKNQTLSSTLELAWMKGEEHAKSWRAKISYLKARAHICQLLGNRDELYMVQERMRELWVKNPHFKNDEPVEYIIVLANLLNAALLCQKWERMESILREMEHLSVATTHEKAEVSQNYLFFSLLLFLNTRRLGKALSLVEKIESALHKYQSRFNRARILAFYHNITLLFLMTNNYEEALNWSRLVLNYEKSDHRNDVRSKARFLQLIFHYELGNYEFLLLSLLRSLERYLNEWDRKNEGEELILQTFQKLPASPKTDHLKELEKLYTRLPQYPQTLCYNEFMFYLEHKLK
ncbi:MAG: hypothetical protein NWR72_10430 [Bacteroidia bacterium]|nr:hypothetical protein [Bacteroidia bacterium]